MRDYRDERSDDLKTWNAALADAGDVLRGQLKDAQDRIAELEADLAFWMGEGQTDRPEIVEYKKLAAILPHKRTDEQTKRIREIAQEIRREDATIDDLKSERDATLETLRDIANICANSESHRNAVMDVLYTVNKALAEAREAQEGGGA